MYKEKGLLAEEVYDRYTLWRHGGCRRTSNSHKSGSKMKKKTADYTTSDDVFQRQISYPPLRGEVCGCHDHIVHALNQHGDLTTAGRLEDALQHLERILEDVHWTHVNLGDNYKHGHVERQCQSEMLLCHPDHAGIRSNLR